MENKKWRNLEEKWFQMFLLLPGLKRFHQVHDMSAFVLNKSGKSGASSIIWMQTRVKCVCVCLQRGPGRWRCSTYGIRWATIHTSRLLFCYQRWMKRPVSNSGVARTAAQTCFTESFCWFRKNYIEPEHNSWYERRCNFSVNIHFVITLHHNNNRLFHFPMEKMNY